MTTSLRSVGRPRNEALDKTILDSASHLLHKFGYFQVTMDDVAQEAGVGKHTLYRRWSSKAELAIAVLRVQAEPLVEQTSGLESFCLVIAKLYAQQGQIFRALLAEAQLDPAVRASIKGMLVAPRRQLLEDIFRERSPRITKIEMEARISLITGAFWYRLMLDLPLDAAIVKEMVKSVL